MIAVERKIEYNSRSGDFRITPLGDIHAGNIGCCWKTVKKVVAQIEKDPKWYWVGMGDYGDWVTVKDKRYRASVLDPRLAGRDDIIDKQYEMVLDLLHPIRDRCLGLIRGNHDDTILQNNGTDVVQRLATALGAKVIGYDGFIVLRFVHKAGGRIRKIKIYGTHGHGGGRKPGAKINRLADTFASYPADFVFMGHVHSMITHSAPNILPDKKLNICSQHHIGLIASAYLKKHTDDTTPTYAEKAGYPPVAIGHNWVTYNPMTDRRGAGFWVDNED